MVYKEFFKDFKEFFKIYYKFCYVVKLSRTDYSNIIRFSIHVMENNLILAYLKILPNSAHATIHTYILA